MMWTDERVELLKKLYSAPNVEWSFAQIAAKLGGGLLEDIASPGNEWWCEGFMAECFRPAVDRKTDIGVFKEILRKATRKRSVNA